VERAIEVRGLKVAISEVPVPIPYGPSFEGERVRKEEMHVEMGGGRSLAFEYLVSKDSAEVEDGKIEVIGPEIDSFKEGDKIPMGIVVEVYGRKMQKDFEPVLERQFHTYFNYGHGIFHMGQRNQNWLRISKEAFKAGYKFEHLGLSLYAKLHEDYKSILDKVQVKIYTEKAKVEKLMKAAVEAYEERDARLADLTDEAVDTYYSCTLCQSFAPNHLCVITPERSGLCGAYSWLDGKAAYEITPSGPNQPIAKGNCLDERLGQWDKINEFVYAKSNNTLERFSAYSMMIDPMTSCGCFQCISVILPATNGIMIVDRNFSDMTPCGMKFSTLAGTVGGGRQVPGFVGHSIHYITSRKFISGDGGIARIVWMPKHLKEEIREQLDARAKEMGLGDNFTDKIADETTAQTEEEVAEFAAKASHPALAMDPML
jgi:acetyl-CoA synthase